MSSRRFDDGDLSPTSPIEETDTGHSETEVLPDPDVGPDQVPGVDAPVRCLWLSLSDFQGMDPNYNLSRVRCRHESRTIHT